MKNTKINYVNRALALAALVALIATPVLRADDNKSGDNNLNDNSGKESVGSVLSAEYSARLEKARAEQADGSDAAMKELQSTLQPRLKEFVQSVLPGVYDKENKTAEIDPNKLVLDNNTAVRGYTLSEGVLYRQTVDGEAKAVAKIDPQSTWTEATKEISKVIFADAANSEGGFSALVYGTQKDQDQVSPADFATVGEYTKGTKLDFFLLAYGGNSGKDEVSKEQAINQDNFKRMLEESTTHFVAASELSSPYVSVSFQDLWGGGDKEITDSVNNSDVSQAAVNGLLATPEPAMSLTFVACLGLALVALRKNKKATTTV